jgi:cytochrome P450
VLGYVMAGLVLGGHLRHLRCKHRCHTLSTGVLNYGHASFGFGTHFCLGAGLARIEARALFAELFSRYSSIRLAGVPACYQYVQLNGWETLPVTPPPVRLAHGHHAEKL